jgi:diguanylate cyclase (GGDEF)-like protein
MKLLNQIFSGYLLVAILVVVVGLAGHHGLSALSTSFDSAVNRNQPVLAALGRIRFLATKLAFSSALPLVPGYAEHAAKVPDKEVAPALVELMAATARYHALIDQYFPDELATSKEIENAVKAYGQAIEVLNSYDHLQEPGKVHAQLEQVSAALSTLQDLVAQAVAGEQREFLDHQETVDSQLQRHLSLLLVVCLGSILAAIGGGAWFARRMTHPLNVLSQAALRMGAGHLDTRAQVQSTNEIGELAKAFNQMASELSSTMIKRDYVEVIFDSLTEGVMVVDESGRVLRCNSAMRKICNDTAIGQVHLCTLSEVFVNDAIADVLKDKPQTQHSFESGLRQPTNSQVIVSVSISPVMNGDTLGERVLLIKDITAQKQMEEKVQQFAFYDPLTHLSNRRLLIDRLSKTVATAKRSGRHGALMFLDLDNFKPLNDLRGHEAGDLLLLEVARRLSTCVREIDTVSRFGGDEFVVLLSDLTADRAESTAQVGMVAEKIRLALAEPYLLTLKHKADATVWHHCTASIGVVVFINHEASPDDIIRWADDAMYQAKDAGRNRVRFHELKGQS